MTRPIDHFRDSPLWGAVEEILAELIATHEITLNTAPDYVIGYVCRELTAKGMTSTRASDTA